MSSTILTRAVCRYFVMVTAFFLLLPPGFFAEAADWKSTGPYGGKINALARSMSNPDVVYAGTSGGVFKSVDDGDTWTGSGLPEFLVRSLAVAPNNANVLYAGLDHGGPPTPVEQGIYKSEDGGVTWRPFGLPGARVNTIAIDPGNPDVIYAGTGKPESSYSGEVVGIFKSTESGTNWQEVLSAGIDAVASLLIDPDNTAYVYAGVYSGDNFRKSANGGDSWLSRHVGYSSHAIVALAMMATLQIAPGIPAAIYAVVAGDDVYWSQDSGVGVLDRGETTWYPRSAPQVSLNPPWLIAEDTSTIPFVTYFASKCDLPGCVCEMFKRDPQDLNYPDWTAVTIGLPLGAPASLTIDSRNQSLLLGLAEAGVYKSTTRGASWINSDKGLNNTPIVGLALALNASETAWATVGGGTFHLARTFTGGDSWEYMPGSPTNLGAVAVDPQNAAVLWTGDGVQAKRSFFVHRSEDGGLHWTSIEFLTYTASTSTGVSSIVINPNDSNDILVGTSGFDGVLARTTNGGLNWQQLGFSTTALAADPNDPGIVYSGKAQTGQVFQYLNVWETWGASEITPIVGIGNVRDLAVDFNSRLYLAASDGLWRRENSVWTKLAGLPTNDITAVAIESTESVYVGTGDEGVFVSHDGGEPWLAFNEGLETRVIRKLAISKGLPRVLYAGTGQHGVWSRTVAGNGHMQSMPWLLLLMDD